MSKMSGGEALVKSLVAEGVEVVFGIPGAQMYGVVAALRDEPGIGMITTRHEQATTYMADGYARVSGKPGVALVVPGVGLYNAAAGLATAYSRSSPVEAVTAERRLIAHYDIKSSEPQYPILEALQKGIPDEACVVWGVTQFGYYARTHYRVNHPKTYVDSGYAFNLGYSFPTALGAKVARPDRPVVCVVGDGGFMFNSSELSSAVKYGIGVVTVVFRNDSYGNVARDLNEFFGGTYETDLVNPDFVAFAESFGAVGMRAEDPLIWRRSSPKRWSARRR